MKVSSFDIFDTCLVRKCGTPMDFFDVLSYKVFEGRVSEDVRRGFVVERRRAEQEACADDRATLEDIYQVFEFSHPQLVSKKDMLKKELECEKMMLVPVLTVRKLIDDLRQNGHKIIFISDMYLSSGFIKSLLVEYGFFHEEDAIYVSCEEGKTKSSGELYKHIEEKEGISCQDWEHYGDNVHSDILMAQKYGIKTHQISHDYTPYPKKWKNNDYNLSYRVESVLAGVSRALHHSEDANSHKDFVLDLIAPFYCSLVYRILYDASRKGIEKLFFCARDAYQMYRIAQREVALFPNLSVEYVYISREALYSGDERVKISYFEKIGLASQYGNVAIVDTTTSGLTLKFLNEMLKKYGFKELFGYYFILWDDERKIDVDMNQGHFELSQAYLINAAYRAFLDHIWVFENFFGLNDQKKTIGYEFKDGAAVPVFSDVLGEEDCIMDNNRYWSQVHESLLGKYVSCYMQAELWRFSDEIFNRVALPTLASFFVRPEKHYLEALVGYRKRDDDNDYIKKETFFVLLRTRGRDSGWKKGTMIYNTPEWLYDLNSKLKSLRRRN